MNANFYTYKEWLQRNPDLVESAKKNAIQCDECCGTGIYECDYGCEHTCKTCDGEGKLPSIDLLEHYRNQLIADKKRVDIYKSEQLHSTAKGEV